MQNQSATWQDLMHSRMRSLKERNFVTTFILQYFSNFFFFYSFLELNNYNGYVCAIYNYCFTAYLQPSQGKINFSPSNKKGKGKINFFLKKIMKQKINAKE